MQIYPSILELTTEGFSNTFNTELPYFDYFQIDITDGRFVPNKTIQIEDIKNVIENHVNNKSFEFHLMVENYDVEIEKIKELSTSININKILIHLKAMKQKLDDDNLISTFDVSQFEFGIVLSPEDEVMSNYSLIKQFTTVQIMTVNPGAQGNPFLPECVLKINQLRDLGYTGEILLDGGINEKTFQIILNNSALPDAVCPGSFLKSNPEMNLKILQSLR